MPISSAVRPFRRAAVLAVLLAATTVLTPAPARGQCQAPPGYYAGIDTSTPASLRQTLHARIENHTRIPDSQTWAVLESADENPANPSEIIDLYKNAAYAKVGGGGGPYNREHTWPSSYGFPVPGSSNYPDTDCHALFLADAVYNSTRGNKPYRNCDPSCNELPTIGGGNGVYPGYSNWESGFGSFGSWQTWAGRRGDVARALFYLDVRYDGSPHIDGSPEPDLILTDCQDLIDASQGTGTNLRAAYMGLLSVLLQWHQQDPPDAAECRRNDVVYAAQGNRNPFVDHPEWVYLLWHRAGRDLRRPWINELHYDNSGADQNEMVEIAGPAGMDLCGWRVAGYNGNGGSVYMNVHLSGTLPGQPGCAGTLAFDFTGMQNGPADGLALVDPLGRVTQFLSYEGSLTAQSGPALGMTSIDIGVAESSSTPNGDSLQLGGTGARPSAFFWQTAQAATPGQPNRAQTLQGGCGQPLLYGSGVNPSGSMSLLDGLPAIGSTLTLGLDNPLGTQAPGSAAFLFLAPLSAPGYPCGIALPGFGMRPGGVGELLLGLTGIATVPAPAWAGPGQPTPVSLSIPPSNTLVGQKLFTQGVLVEGVSHLGLTDAIQLIIDV